MQKPNNYDNTPAGGNYEAPELGGHHMIIKQVNETQTKAGKPMVVILVDFAKNDKQPELFMTQFKDDIRPERSGRAEVRSTALRPTRTARPPGTLRLSAPVSRSPTAQRSTGWITVPSGVASSRTRRSAAFTASFTASIRARKKSGRNFDGS